MAVTLKLSQVLHSLQQRGQVDEDAAQRLIPPKREYQALLRACSREMRDVGIIELLQVGETTRALLDAHLVAAVRTEAEVKETLAGAVGLEGLDTHLAHAVERRRQELVAERRELVQRIERGNAERSREWLRGIDDLSSAGYDLLALRVLFPA